MTAVANVYFLEVANNFEEQIKVTEGDYGKFFSKKETLDYPMIIDGDKKVLKDLYQLLGKK